MLDCVSVENMRISDQNTIKNFTPSLTLMYRAAMGVYSAAEWHGDIVIAAGGGNNGGDGFALSCILKENGFDCRVVTLSDKLSSDSSYYAEKAAELGVVIQSYRQDIFDGSDIIVDCLLGTGFRGSVREPYASAIRDINRSDAFIISVDINSGMNGDTGEWETAVSSDLTVCIGYIKNGMVSPSAPALIRRLVCADIGIVLDHEENKICDVSEWKSEYENSGKYLRRPPYLDMNVIDVSDK